MPPPLALIDNLGSQAPAEPGAPALGPLGSRMSDYDAAPGSAGRSFAPIRPDRLTVWPADDGTFTIAVRWQGRECILRAVVVRRLLTEGGFPATAGNSIDGRTWEVTASQVPANEVAEVIETYIW